MQQATAEQARSPSNQGIRQTCFRGGHGALHPATDAGRTSLLHADEHRHGEDRGADDQGPQHEPERHATPIADHAQKRRLFRSDTSVTTLSTGCAKRPRPSRIAVRVRARTRISIKATRVDWAVTTPAESR